MRAFRYPLSRWIAVGWGVVMTTALGGCFSASMQWNSLHAVPFDPSATLKIPPVLNSPSDWTYPGHALAQGSAATVDFDNVALVTPTDFGMAYACAFDRTVGPMLVSPQPCSALPGAASFDPSTGILNWTPGAQTWGIYKVQVTGTNPSGSDKHNVLFHVRAAYVTANLLADWVADFATGSGPATNPYLFWRDLSGGAHDLALSLFSPATAWNSLGAPTFLNYFSAQSAGGTSTDGGTVGPVLSGSSTFMFSLWATPRAITTQGLALLSNQNSAGNGFILRQTKRSSQGVDPRLELASGLADYDKSVGVGLPVYYWRLGETVGTVANDSAHSNTGTYSSAAMHVAAAALANDADGAASFSSTLVTYVTLGAMPVKGSGAFSIEAWINTSATTPDQPILSSGTSDNVGGHVDFLVDTATGLLDCKINLLGSVKSVERYNDGQWHHVVCAYDGVTHLVIYADGVLAGSGVLGGTTSIGTGAVGPYAFIGHAYDATNFTGTIDEVATYNRFLGLAEIQAHYIAGLPSSYVERINSMGNLTNYWRLDEPSGTVATDSGLTPVNGTYTGFTNFVGQAVPGALAATEGDYDGAADFNGASRYVSMASGLAVTGDFTVSAWVQLAPGVAGTCAAALPAMTAATIFTEGTGTGSAIQLYLNASCAPMLRLTYTPATVTFFTSSVAIRDGLWHHVAATRQAGIVRVFVDGKVTSSSTGQSVATLAIGAPGPGSIGLNTPATADYFNGVIDEVGMHGTALSPGQIWALAQGPRTICRTSMTLANSLWYHLSGTLDGGGGLMLYVNGRPQCLAQPASLFSTSSTNPVIVSGLADRTAGWVGYLSDVKIYASGLWNDVVQNFTSMADRYRAVPGNTVIQNGLIAHWDAANADLMRPSAAGCAGAAMQVWYDISTVGWDGWFDAQFNCTPLASGWAGNGTVGNPYRLIFNANGTADRVMFGPIDLGTQHTVSTWIQFSALGGVNNVVIAGETEANPGYALYVNSGTTLTYNLRGAGGVFVSQSTGSALVAGTWYHLTMARNGDSIAYYLNGAPLGSPQSLAAINVASSAWPLTVSHFGGYLNGTFSMTAAIADMEIYSRGLSAAEVRQNCRALSGRFGVVCN